MAACDVLTRPATICGTTLIVITPLIAAALEDLMASVLPPHMGVILVSLWSMFVPARARRLERRTGSSKSP